MFTIICRDKTRLLVELFLFTQKEFQKPILNFFQRRVFFMKFNLSTLQTAVADMTKSANKARAWNSSFFISTEKVNGTTYLTILFNGAEISGERKVPVLDSKDPVSCTAPIRELATAVAAIPQREEIEVVVDGNQLLFKYGKDSVIRCPLLPETSPPLQIPDVVESVVWGPGVLQGLAKQVPYFAGNPDDMQRKSKPQYGGIHISKNEMDEVYVQCTDAIVGTRIQINKLGWGSTPMSLPFIPAIAEAMPHDAEIEIGFPADYNVVIVKGGYTTLVSRVYLGEYSDFTKFFNFTFPKLSVDKHYLIDLCKRVRNLNKLQNQTSNTVTFRVQDGKLFAEIPQHLFERVPCTFDDGLSDFKVDFNRLEMVASFLRVEKEGAGEIDLYCHPDNRAPITIMSPDDERVKCFLMPVTLR